MIEKKTKNKRLKNYLKIIIYWPNNDIKKLANINNNGIDICC